MLKIIVLILISILTSWMLAFELETYDLKDDLTVVLVFGIFELIKYFILIFMLLWYVLK